MEFKDLSVRTPSGQELLMKDHLGKVVLVVNTATRCGLAPQFRELDALHQKYRDKGLVILGFPCNQFQGQEPESNESMVEACQVNFGVTFQLTQKIDVNGKETHPVFAFLKKKLPGRWGKVIKWNFTKFLISPDGKPLRRYGPTFKPASLEEDIVPLLPGGGHSGSD